MLGRRGGPQDAAAATPATAAAPAPGPAQEETAELRHADSRAGPRRQGLRLHDIRPTALHPQLHRAGQPGRASWPALRRLPRRGERPERRQGAP